MTKSVFLQGMLTTFVVCFVLFWGVGVLANSDPLWFIRSFDPRVSVVTIYWDDDVYILESGDAGFEELATIFVDGVAHWRGFEGMVVFSEINLQDYRQRGRLLEFTYENPVQVHTRHSFSKAPTFLVPVNRTHAYYRRVFGLPETADWAIGAINMAEDKFGNLVLAAENAVLVASGELIEEQAAVLAGSPTSTQEPKVIDPEPTPISTTTPAPIAFGTTDLEGLLFSDFLEQSYTKLLMRDPEYITEMGLADEMGTGNDKLTDLSDAYIRETQALEKNIFDILNTYEWQNLGPAEQRSYNIYKWYLEDIIRGHTYMYNDYPLNQFILSVHNSTIHFFTEIHPITSYADAVDYISRLSQIESKFSMVLEGLKIREHRGVILPRFLIQWTLRDLTSMAKAEAQYTPYYEAFVDKVSQIDGINSVEKQALYDDAEDMVTAAVLPAYQLLADYYGSLLPVATDDVGVWKFSDGEAYYDSRLKHFTSTDLTADEIHQIGLREVDRISLDMRSIFDALGYPEDESLPDLFERVARDGGVLYGEDILHEYENIIQQANVRVQESFDLLPSTDVVVIQDTVGGYYVPPAKDGSRPGAFYASASGTNPKFSMPTLAYHEAVPGHHFQIAIAQELNIPTFRQDLHLTAYTEGWALYAEYLAWELGFYEDDPYGNLGRLQAEMFRAVRLVVDTGIHAKGWTFAQAVEYMHQHTGQTQRMVEYQIARYIAWPGQAVSYKIGMLKILELRERAMDALGDDFDIRAFHNVILGDGAVPLSILEQIVDDYIAAELAQS